MLAPPLHHGAAAFNVVCSIVGAANLILVYVSQSHLDQFGLKALFVERGAGNRAHSVTNQATGKTHTFQGHVRGLAVAMVTWVAVGGEYILTVSAVWLDCFKNARVCGDNGIVCERRFFIRS